MKHLARNLFLAVLLGTAAVASASAQSRYTDATARSMFSIGVGAAPGITVPLGPLDDGDFPALGFAFRGGLNITYPLTNDLSTFFNAGLDMRNPGVREDTLLDPRFNSVRYFYVQPGISYSSFGLSLNVGIPLGGSAPVPRFGPNVDLDATTDVPSDVFDLMLEPRLGGMLVLMENESYWLGLDLSVGYPLNELYKKEYQRPDSLAIDDGSTLISKAHLFTAHLGLSFQFGLFDAF